MTGDRITKQFVIGGQVVKDQEKDSGRHGWTAWNKTSEDPVCGSLRKHQEDEE